MKEFLIIGSGFSALASYLHLKKYSPEIISYNSNVFLPNEFILRKNINANKALFKKNNSFGNFKYQLSSGIKIHDRLSPGGNSNIWGGFIDISSVSKNFIRILNNNDISLDKLDFKKNGYISNRENIRQLRNKNKILDSKNILKKKKDGFVYSLELNGSYTLVNYFSLENKLFKEKFRKVILAISFPQLIDLLYRSNIITKDIIISLSEFNHRFVKTVSSKINKEDHIKNCIVKYDFIRVLKHYFGLKTNIDKFRINFPFYVDQIYSFPKRKLRLKLNYNSRIIYDRSNNIKFGDSIHYCDLKLDNIGSNQFINNLSSNIFGVSTPFINQEIPGPISNDIVNKVMITF